MAKRTRATSVDYANKDETGAIMGVKYDCPHCHYATGELIFIGASGATLVGSDFETDQVCGVCNEDVTIEVPASLY
jgi:hypothetical protein